MALTPWHLALLAISVVYGFSVRQRVNVIADELGASVNVWDHVLTFMLDPYYISYLFTPVWLVSSCVAIYRHFNVPALIRLGSYRAWLYRSVLRATSRLALLMLMWLVAAVIISSGLPLAATWSAASSVSDPLNQVLGIVSAHGIAPLLVLALQLLLIGLILLCLYAVLATIHLLVARQLAIYTAAAVLFLAQLISFRHPIEAAPFLDLANFFLLHRSFTAYEPVVLVFLPLIVAGGLCYAVVRYQDRRRNARFGFPVSRSILIYAGLCILGLVYALIFQLQSTTHAPTDVLFAAFYGVSAEGFEWNLYLYHSIVFLGFAYLFLLALDNELKARIYYVALRHGSPTRWLSHFLLPFAKRAPIMLAALFTGALLISMAGSSNATGNAVTNLAPERGWMLYQFFVNGTLQLLCYVLLVFSVSWLSGRPTAGLFALAGLLVAGLPAVNSSRLLPAALNSLGYLGLGESELLRITAVLGVYVLVLLLAALLIVKSPKLFFNERA